MGSPVLDSLQPLASGYVTLCKAKHEDPGTLGDGNVYVVSLTSNVFCKSTAVVFPAMQM